MGNLQFVTCQLIVKINSIELFTSIINEMSWLWGRRLSWFNPNQGIQVDDSGNLQTSKNFFNGDVRVTVKDANGNILDQKDESIQGCTQAVLK